ncbi:MAG: SigE family RNA polymerase sigma factor [Nocardioidaceae bacterium]|nr:SigE family RNA polymerase sigma factor [Nocardioidaceae bacterium]
MTAVVAVPANGVETRAGNEYPDFDAFVRARLPDLLRFGRALTGSEDAAADLVQDALERTLLQWTRLDSRDRPEGYVRRIMVNRNISIWRRLRRERLTDEPPDRGWRDRHHNCDLWRAIGELPPRQRAVIALRYYEDLTEAEVALVMDCSVGTVKSQAAKALAKLRDRSESFSDVPLVAPEHAR